MTFDQEMAIGQGIMGPAAGQPVQRETLLGLLKLTNNQATRALITASSKYGITKGAHDAKELRLTKLGREAVDPNGSLRQRAQARFELAVQNVAPFNHLYEHFSGGHMPAKQVMQDSLSDLNDRDRGQCVDIFIDNAKCVGILQTREGAPFLATIDQLLDDLPSGRAADRNGAVDSDGNAELGVEVTSDTDFERVCFFISPIGEEGSEDRKHSDAVLASFVEPMMDEHRLRIVRADKITEPGMISSQVLKHIVRSRLVVADLSFHNPNVFYELAIRHATGKPTVHIIREGDPIPFDVKNFRTPSLPLGEVYGLLAKFETAKSEIAQQIRQALADGTTTNNPLLAFYPEAQLRLNDEAEN